MTWTGVEWAGGVAPTLTQTSGYADVFALQSFNNTNDYFIGSIIAQNIDSTNL